VHRIPSNASDLSELLERCFSEFLPGLLLAVERAAREQEAPVYLVGGVTRDLLRTGELTDVDLVVEGDGPGFAHRLAELLNAELTVHKRFGTARLGLRAVWIDVASARQETYPQPGALPQVRAGTIEEDLARRDFTINTLAVRLDEGRPYEVIDLFNGMRDLARRDLRILHDRSFSDDPTRILRAVRFESRLGFRMEPHTESLAVGAARAGAFTALSSGRLGKEVRLLLATPGEVVLSLERIQELGLAPSLHPRLRLERELFAWLAQLWTHLELLQKELAEPPPVAHWWLHLLAVTWELREADRGEVAERLAIDGDHRSRLISARQRIELVEQGLAGEKLKPHQVDAWLRELSSEETLLLWTRMPAATQELVRTWYLEWRPLNLAISGEHLVSHGFAPGPLIGRALEQTRAARLDGDIDAEGELAFAIRWLWLEQGQKGRHKADEVEGLDRDEIKGSER
jgi:tRNA nucleotidyltransferase (CCA-adding enzyme)